MSYESEATGAEMRHQIGQACLVIRSHTRLIDGYASMIHEKTNYPPCLSELIEAENTLESALRMVRRAKAIVAVEA